MFECPGGEGGGGGIIEEKGIQIGSMNVFSFKIQLLSSVS